jgi:transcription termination factor NusB
MTMPKEPLSLLSKCNDQQQQLDAIFEQLSQELTLSAINRLKAQVLVLSDWLYSLNDENSDVVLAQAMRYLTTYLPHTNQAFCAGIITAKFCHRLTLHGQHARLLISAALTMNISLLLANKSLS